MGQAFGGTIVRAKNLMHGKTDMIHHNGSGLFAGLDNPFQATRYHSLVIQPDTLSPEFEITAWSEEPGGYREIMGIAHREHPLFGVQFHPESFLTHAGYDILRKFLGRILIGDSHPMLTVEQALRSGRRAIAAAGASANAHSPMWPG